MESAVVRKVTLRLVPFLFLLYIVAYLDRTNAGFAALQMQQELALSDKAWGLGLGMFFAGYFFFQVPSNMALQRVGARRWIATLMAIWGVISSAMVLVRGPQSLYAVRFLLGAAEAGFFPGVIFYLKNWFPAATRARTVARFMTAAPLAGVVGGPISGALLGLHMKLGLAGWQWMFLMEAIPAVVLGAVVLAYLPDRPENARWLTENERDWLLERLKREQATPIGGLDSSAFAFLTMGRVWLLAAVYFGLNNVSYGITLWLPKMIQSLSGVGNFTIGVMTAIPNVSAALAMVYVGLHSDRSGERRWHTALPAFVGAAALVGAAYSSTIMPAIVLISVAVLCVYSMMGPFWAMPTGFLPVASAAAGIAFINSIGNLGGFVGPYLIGLVRNSTGQFRGGLLLVSAALTVGGMLALQVRLGESSERP